MSGRPPRVLLDVNLFVSYLLSPADTRRSVVRVINRALRGEFTLLLPEHVVEELLRTIDGKSYLRARIDTDKTTRLLTLLERLSEMVPRLKEPFPTFVRDAKDDYLLAYAVVYKADALVTGDADLLSLDGRVAKLRIVAPARFLEMLEGGAGADPV